MQVQFFHSSGQANIRPELDSLLGSGSQSIRAAVCFFTEPGRLVMSRHAAALARPGSFFVASIDLPTNLDALAKLHRRAPGNIYIHLGGTTPEEIDVGRSLMHSKVLLAVGDEKSRLWVGSQNLTGRGIEGGNFEAGIEITAPTRDQPIQDAIAHLEACRATAEVFDPSQMARYRQIQSQKLPRPPWIIPMRLLVIHAEARILPSSMPFTVHIRIVPTDFDSYFVMDREVRLYLHPVGALRTGIPVDFSNSTLWNGTLTAVVRTERHPRSSGLHGRFDTADFELDMPDITSTPILVPAGQSRVAAASSQVILKMDARGRQGEEYSLEDRPVQNMLEGDLKGQELHEIDSEMTAFFTPESVSEGRLVYRPVQGVRQRIKIEGYEETMRSNLPQKPSDVPIDKSSEQIPLDHAGSQAPPASSINEPALMYSAKEKERPVDAFFFVTKHLIDRTRQ